jgi:hypothetical protein
MTNQKDEGNAPRNVPASREEVPGKHPKGDTTNDKISASDLMKWLNSQIDASYHYKSDSVYNKEYYEGRITAYFETINAIRIFQGEGKQ